jgi:hypothetical protein
MGDLSLMQEAEIFGQYLLKRAPGEAAKTLYSQAISSTSVTIEINDQKLLRFVLHNTWSIGLVDSGLALLNPGSEVRRRLYMLFCILESSPEHHDLFLPKHRNSFYLLAVLFSGFHAVIKAIVGSVLVKIIA